jgi:succinyl-CoA synthetase beta subunit
MKIHEYQAKRILREYGIPVPDGEVARNPEDARSIAEKIGFPVVIKAQIHAGGRGKAGGIKTASSPEEVENITRELIGKNLVTSQTGPGGTRVNCVLIEKALTPEKEIYLGILIDRSAEAPVIISSIAGGMEIEEIAEKNPELINRVRIDPAYGFTGFHARKLSYALGLGELSKKMNEIIRNLYRLFVEKDASLAEINPLAAIKDGLVALDAKMNFDDDAIFRHPEIKELRDVQEEDPLERIAVDYKISYVRLDGWIGCMVNGAGLAMATMDLIKLAGGSPANFLDVGGGASEEQIKNAFKILVSDKNVRAILINIFGGILRCDRVARGLISAASEIEVRLPMVVRLEGTNVEEGKKILKDSKLEFEVADSLWEAAKKVVSLGK